jgi:Peptidase A4 family
VRTRGASLFFVVAIATLAFLSGSAAALAQAPSQASARLPLSSHPIVHRRQPFGRQGAGAAPIPTTSQNWAGYDATGGGFTSATASWVEPAVAAGATETDVVFWVGLDGDGSAPVEQTGTAAVSQGGSVTHYAWYEMYPAAEVPIVGMTVSPGDQMTGAVTSDGLGGFTLILTDETTRHSFTTTQSNGVTDPFSAEVIAEAPATTDGTVLSLADFGSVSFTSCAFNGRPLSSFALNQIDMVSGGGATEATSSALGADGASFSVTVARALTPTLTLKLSGLTGGALKLGKRLSATGKVRPTSLAGGAVRLALQRRQSGSWHQVTVAARAISSTGAYSWTYKPARRGSYRLRATIARTATSAAAATKWNTLRVK